MLSAVIDSIINPIKERFDIIILSIIFFSTWLPMLKGGWVSDDWEGIAKFSDRWDGTKKIDSYKEGDKEYKHCQFNPSIPFPGSVIRWLRLLLGRKFKVIGKDNKNHDILGYVQEPFRHHLISLCIHYASFVVLYIVFNKLFGSQVTFYALLLFAVHPATTQAVAWCSGIGYLLCLLGLSVSLLSSLFSESLLIKVPLVTAFSFLSAYGLFSGTFNFIPLLFLGDPISAGCASLSIVGTGIKQAKQITGIRKTEFKKQNMSRSTYWNWRKPIVMVKTFFYYILLVIFPRKLGLFHKWGYHYDDRIERTDKPFWLGLATLCLIGWVFYIGDDVYRFGILWFFVYLIVFSNFITAMQFVADRYLFISTVGYCLVVAKLFLVCPQVVWFLAGLYLMRTWMHLRTYKDEVSFYESNVFNFPNSEVAKGNLGVAYMHRGQPGKAIDTWIQATQDDDLYDVPHYNLYSVFRQNGDLNRAKFHLEKCLNAKVVHFQERWQQEYEQLKIEMGLRRPIPYQEQK